LKKAPIWPSDQATHFSEEAKKDRSEDWLHERMGGRAANVAF